MKEKLKKHYEELKDQLHINTFEAGVIVGVFIAAYSYNKNRQRLRNDISKTLQTTVINVRNVQ